MIDLKIKDVDLSTMTTEKKREHIEAEIKEELDKFSKYWIDDLGLSPISAFELASVQTYIRWRLVHG